MTLDQIQDFVFEDSGLALCGCGSPQETLEWIYSVMLALHNKVEKDEWLNFQFSLYRFGSVAAELLLNVLTRARVCEHGSSIGGSWLTLRGLEVLVAIKEFGVEEILKIR